MAAVNHARMKNLLLDLVRIDSLSRRERACRARLVREMEARALVPLRQRRR